MPIKQVDGPLLKAMVLEATRTLDANKEAVNALNVFPVPDGDTGSNMSLTMLSAAREVERAPDRTVGAVAQALAQGSLMGARGNSGVILSQLFRGFARYAADRTALDARDLARALQAGVETAYKAVMKPVEGTILTVAREAAQAAVQAARSTGDVIEVIEAAHRAALAALERTPELLPVLKKAGVVDSGGKGYTFILAGYLAALRARESQGPEAPVAGAPAVPAREAGRDASPATTVAFRVDEEISDIRYPYDTEFFIRGREIPLQAIAEQLNQMGDSVYVVGSPELAKVHIHTDNPGRVLDFCLRFGELIRIEIHNMREQHADLLARAGAAAADPPAASAAADPVPAPSSDPAASPAPAPNPVPDPPEAAASAVVAVAAGDGLEAILKSLGVAQVVRGGQTMNPSTQDLLEAIEACPADRVFVLPNNKNVILAAEQAATLSRKEVHVIPTRSIPQGIAALLAWQPDGDPEKTRQAMLRTLEEVQTGEVTYAVRDTTFGEMAIREGDILGIWNGQIVATGATPEEMVKAVLERMMAERPGEVITLYWGEGVDQQRAEALAEELRRLYPQCEVEVQYGGQPLYFYIFSLE
ncbi:MAG: DAK2 domain-containing protein [Firmicutes bacterium]|nr:DAK2 domain-containing protein [Bacillota bacterium]